MDVVDRVRKEIEGRLETLLSDADKLRKALAALDPRGSSPSPARQSRSTATASDSRPRREPAKPGATKRRVLGALSDGKAKTAGEVASATGIKRGTVSTTLSKLAQTGEVVKAERGYRLPV